MILEKYIHAPGRHCGTTSLSRLLNFHGHQITEAMCLGLSSGIDFFYLTGDVFNPTHMWLGRGPDLEVDCFRRLGVPVQIERTEDNDLAWRWVKDEIDAGRPAMIQVDIRWLDYYQTNTHFGGHKILIVGYDESAQTATVSDNEFDRLQTLPLASLAKARTNTIAPFELANEWYQPQMPEQLIALEIAVPGAIHDLAERMLSARALFIGVSGLEAAARDLPAWAEADDWSWCVRFAYQNIEKRGTGGGAFRKMYAEFLRQTTPFCPDIDRLNLAEQMEHIAKAWADLAVRLRAISDLEAPAGLGKAGEKLLEIARLEREYYQTALQCRCLVEPS